MLKAELFPHVLLSNLNIFNCSTDGNTPEIDGEGDKHGYFLFILGKYPVGYG